MCRCCIAGKAAFITIAWRSWVGAGRFSCETLSERAGFASSGKLRSSRRRDGIGAVTGSGGGMIALTVEGRLSGYWINLV